MSSSLSHRDVTRTDGSSQDITDAEEGLYNHTNDLTVTDSNEKKETFVHVETIPTLSLPTSPIHEGITPFSSVPILSLAPAPQAQDEKPSRQLIRSKPAVQEVNRLIKFQLWFNTYRKFFTFVTILNGIGIIMAAMGRFRYADNHLGALVLGNLLAAILMRNELFLRVLYSLSIYGLRSVGFLIDSKGDYWRGISGRQYGWSYQWPLSCNMLEVSIPDVHCLVLRKTNINLASSKADNLSRWLVFKIVTIIRERARQHDAVIATGIITNIFVLISVLSAFPWIRKSVLNFSLKVIQDVDLD